MDKNMPPPPPPGFTAGMNYAAPPPPPYHSGQPASVIVVGAPAFGSESQRLTCPSCHNAISTQIETESNTKTHLFALLLCLIGCWCCAPCVYCMDTCLVKKHYCPSCRTYLGQSEN